MKTPAEIRYVLERLQSTNSGAGRDLCWDAAEVIEQLLKQEPRKEIHLHYHPGKDQVLKAVGDVVTIAASTAAPTAEQMATLEKLSNG